jgi:hypothetical protein
MTTRYRPGVLSRVLAWVDALPGHGWWVYPLLFAVLFAWSHGVLWASGHVPIGSTLQVVTVSLFYPPYTLAAIALINRSADRALAAFWPATGWPDEERDAWRYRFINSPAGFGLAAFAFGVIVAVIAFFSASAAVFGTGDDRLVLFVAYLPVAALGYAVVLLAFIHTTHQLRLVARIHREATAIDPFDRVSVYAFSSMTAVTGLAYLASGYFTLVFNGAFQAGNFVALVVLVTLFAIAIACFVLPLWGIHDRLVDEKQVLARDVELRLSQLTEDMYRRIDGRELEATKAVSDALVGVAEIRKRISDIPTWPWRPQVLSGFLSALLVPVAVYVLTRALGNQLGP